MAATRRDIDKWLEIGKINNCTHVLVVTDTYDWYDYPVYVHKNDNVNDLYKAHSGKNMQTVTEVYNLSMNIEAQLNEYRAYNF